MKKIHKTQKRATLLVLLLALLTITVLAQTTTPTISNLDFVYETTNTTIMWNTDITANGTITYGTTSDLGEQKSTTAGTAHSVTINTVDGIRYYYKLTSCVGSNCASTGINSFISGSYYVQATVPTRATTHNIDITGKTRSGATVTITINGQLARQSIVDGPFLFRNVQLQDGTNNITIKSAKATEEATKNYVTIVDSTPPTLNINIPTVVTTQQTQATITLSEPVTIMITTEPQGQKTNRVTGINATQILNDLITLEWSNTTNAKEYAIYRNGKRIAIVTELGYTDNTVASDTTYDYIITAITEQCVESEDSLQYSAKTSTGTKQATPVTEVPIPCRQQPIVRQLNAGTHTIDITLNEGDNLIRFEAKDAAGFTSIRETNVIYDIAPPEFISTNLDQISPTYDRIITIAGQISEQASVTVFIDGKPEATEITDENGYYNIKVTLGSPLTPLTTDPLQGIAYSVYLEATDQAGQSARTTEETITKQVCGGSNLLTVTRTPTIPTTLNPRLLKQGFETLGLAFDYSYNGAGEITVNQNAITVTAIQPSPAIAKRFDNGYVTVQNTIARPDRNNKNKGTGYIQMAFGKINDPWEMPETEQDILDKVKPENPTPYDEDKRIYEHRNKDCQIAGAGCMRIWLELEIPFQRRQTGMVDPLLPMQQTNVENLVHKECIIIETGIDAPAFDPRQLPEGPLAGGSDAAERAINLIDDVLPHVNRAGEAAFGLCTVSSILMTIPQVNEAWNCRYSNVVRLGPLSSGYFEESVAAAGLCKEAYEGEAETNCLACQDSKQSIASKTEYYTALCDRVMCPAAPTLQSHIQTKANEPLKPITGLTAELTYPYGYELSGKKVLASGSDCAAWVAEHKGNSAFTLTTTDIENIYRDYLKHENDEDTTPGSCSVIHPATPECCGYEYMTKWDSACAFGDEIKDSACLAAQGIGKNSIQNAAGSSIICGTLSPSSSLFCGENYGATPDFVPVIDFSTTKQAQLGLNNFGDDQRLFITLTPKTGDATEKYDIKLGYQVRKLQFQQSNQSQYILQSEQNFFTQGVGIIQLRGTANFGTTYFGPDARATYADKGTIPKGFAEYLCTQAGQPTDCVNGEEMYKEVMAKIGTPTQQYIVKPDDGFFTSLQCVCLPAIQSHLELYRGIAQGFKDCFDTIMTTGTGSPGICQEVLTQYACDLLWDALSCFVDTFGSSAGTRIDQDTLLGGNVFGAVSDAGANVANGIASRYGTTNMYKAMFDNKKLQHSICKFAFQNEWDYDLNSIYDQGAAITQTDSVALVATGTRRFNGFDPSTTPQGLTTWTYEFSTALFAGADLDVSMELKCSAGYCPENENQKCDCAEIGEQTLPISPTNIPTKLAKGQSINENVIQRIQGRPYRYDTVILKYRYTDSTGQQQEKKAEKKISPIGTAPEYCHYDILTQNYRCIFGDDESGIQFNSATLTGGHTTTQGTVYAQGDTIPIGLSIKQVYPTPPENKNTKHLKYRIYNTGKLVTENNGYHRLTRNGDYTLSLQDLPGNLMVKSDWFITPTTARPYTTMSWTSGTTNIIPGDSMIQDIKITQAGNKYERSIVFVIELERTTTDITYKIRTAGASLAIDQNTGFTSASTEICSGTVGANGQILCFPLTAPTTTASGTATSNLDYVITLKQPVSLSPGQKRQFHITWQPAIIDQCSATEKTKPQRFALEIVAYDSDDNGAATSQQSINPLTATPAIIQKDFYAVCENTATYSGIVESQTTTREDQIWMQLKQTIEQKQTEQNRKIYEIQTLTDLTKTDTQNQLRQKVSELITIEQTMLTQLQQQDMSKITKTEVTTAIESLKTTLTSQITTLQQHSTAMLTTVAPQLEGNKTAVYQIILTLNAEENKALVVLNDLLVTTQSCDVKVNGEQYFCSTTGLNAPYIQDPYRKCSAGSCYKIPKDSFCDKKIADTTYACQHLLPGLTGATIPAMPFDWKPLTSTDPQLLCPTGQVCQKSTPSCKEEKIGNRYYWCTTDTITNPNMKIDTTKRCDTGVCYYVEDQNYCKIENTAGKNVECRNSCDSGWSAHPLLCTKQDTTCCEKP